MPEDSRLTYDQADALPGGRLNTIRLLNTVEQILAVDATEVRPALDQASDLLVAALDADKFDIFLYEPSSDSLVALGTSHTDMGRLQKASGLDRLPLSNGGEAVLTYREGKPFITGQAQDEPNVVRGIKETLGVRSLMYVRMHVEGEPRGVVSAASAKPGLFTHADLEYMGAVANWVGSLIHRTELVERIRLHAVDESRRATAEQLVTVLAHDLGNRITPAIGRVDIIRRYAQRDGNEKYLKAATSARKSLENVHDLIKDLLDVSRLERGMFSLDRAKLNIVQLVKEVAEELPVVDANVHVRVPDELYVEADPARTRQALENLLANAVKHGPRGVPVFLQVDREIRLDGDWAAIIVRDEGPGIPPEVLPALFTPFAAGPGSTGLGIGLFLAHRIAQAHGGSLTVDTAPGGGTTFCLRLPLFGSRPDQP